MCARAAYAVLAAAFTFVVVTVAAFAYLPWWQALAASAGTFAALVLVARYLLRLALGRLAALAQGAVDVRGRVLRGASVDVHSARPVGGPAGLMVAGDATADEVEYVVELTIFPDGQNSFGSDEWDPAGLAVVPAASAPPRLLGGPAGPAFTPTRVELVDGGEAEAAGGPVRGPRRVRLAVAVPRGVRALALRYGYEQFGTVPLPLPTIPGS